MEFLNIENRKNYKNYQILAAIAFRDEELKSQRNLDIMDRYIIFEKIKEEGNEFYNNQNFDKAIGKYIVCYGLFNKLSIRENKKIKNFRICEESEVRLDEIEANIKRSSIFYTLLRLAQTYLKIGEFDIVKKCLNEAAKINKNNSLLYFMKSLAISTN